jgi:glutamine amidotransferase
MSHIRMATEGAVALRNTQPFVRELGGRMHAFAHNGHLPAIREQQGCELGSFHPVGDTDSEYAFCVLLERLESLWRGGTDVPSWSDRCDVITRFAANIREIGLANFIYCDGEAMYAHGHRRKQADGEFKSPGLHVLRRRCSSEDAHAGTAGVSVTSSDQEVALVASVPLTTEDWEPLDEGELVVMSAANFIRQLAPQP